MNWIYNGKEIETIPDDYIGFVYLITNVSNQRKYIGKKQLFRAVTKRPLKGKIRKRHTKVESDWRTYYGSSEELKSDLIRHGENNFKREIISFHKTKGELAYAELKLQIDNEVLFRDDFYNGIIQVKIHKSHVKPK